MIYRSTETVSTTEAKIEDGLHSARGAARDNIHTYNIT